MTYDTYCVVATCQIKGTQLRKNYFPQRGIFSMAYSFNFAEETIEQDSTQVQDALRFTDVLGDSFGLRHDLTSGLR